MDIPRQFPRRDYIFHYAFVKVHTAEDKISLTLSNRPLSAIFRDKTYICPVRLDCHYTGELKFCQGQKYIIFLLPFQALVLLRS